MTTKNFNAKKMFMSAVAAAVFSFVFTANANANPTQAQTPQKGNLEIRVKGTAPKHNVGIRVKGTAPKDNVGIRVKDNPNSFEKIIEDVLGIRVKIRVK